MGLKIGQKVTLPKLGCEIAGTGRRRKAVVVGEYEQYYVFQVAEGYRECYLKTDLSGVKLA